MIRGPILTLAALAFVLAPLGVSAADIPSAGSLPHGGSYLIYRDSTIASAAIDLWFRAPSAGYDEHSPGIARLSATAAAAAKLESGTTLVSLVRSVGGRFSINVYPDIVGVSIVVPASAARRAIAAASAAYFAPAIDADALKTAQRDAAVLAVTRRYSSDDIVHDALFAQLFSGGAARVAPLPDNVAEMTKVTLVEVSEYAKRAFRAGNATMTLAGNVDATAIDAVTSGNGGAMDAPIRSSVAASPQASFTIAGNVAGAGIAWVGPPIADERAATAMDFIADYLFRDASGTVSRALGTSDAYVNGQFITLNDPGVMLVTIGGDGAAAAQGVVLDAVRALQKPLSAQAFAAAREAFLYHVASDTQLPIEQADNLGWYAAEGNPGYAPSDPRSLYWERARSLDPAYIAQIASTYLAHPVTVRLNATQPKENPS